MAASLKRNILYSVSLQLGNYTVPLLTLPWLTRALGIEGFGRLGFATAVVAYFILLAEWGYQPLSATRDVAVVKDNPHKRSQIFWGVMAGRTLLSLFGFAGLALLIRLVEKLSVNSELLWILSIGVFASVISPVFYLQGIEKISRATIVNLCVKLASVPLVFLLVHDVADIYVAALIQSLSLCIAALISLWDALRKKEILWVRPTWFQVALLLKKTTTPFISNLASNLYTNSSAAILGFVSTEVVVGAFVAAYTLIKAVLGLMGAVSQALFPRISWLLAHDRARAEQMLRRIFVSQSALGLTASVCTVVFSPIAIPILFGEAYLQAVPVLFVLAALPLVIAMSNVFGVQILVSLGNISAFSKVLIAAGLINVALVFPLGARWGATGVAASMVLVETLVTGLMALLLKRSQPGVWHQLWNRKNSYD